MGTSLLGEHVADQVAHTVAVAKLVVVPADQRRTAGEDLGNPKKKGGSNGAVNSPWNQLDEVVVESDAGAGVKDGGVRVAVEVCGHDLSRERQLSVREAVRWKYSRPCD